MKNKRPIIGMMGGVGSGKSTVAAMLRDLGCVVANADTNAAAVLQQEEVIAQIISWWGKQLLDEEKQPMLEAPSNFVSLRSTTGVSEADKLSFAGMQRLG